MEGTATISLDTLDELRKKAEEAETEKKRRRNGAIGL